MSQLLTPEGGFLRLLRNVLSFMHPSGAEELYNKDRAIILTDLQLSMYLGSSAHYTAL